MKLSSSPRDFLGSWIRENLYIVSAKKFSKEISLSTLSKVRGAFIS